MNLLITTPTEVLIRHDDVLAIQAEDESGAFGIWPRHADFVTALSISVVGWRRAGGRQSYCAVRGGLFTVTGGETVAIATREAIPGDDLAALEAIVRERLTADAEADRQAWAHAEQLRIQAIRQVIGFLRPSRADATGGPP
jgi:F-type H+-transporting ATPase subunit epsilon